MTSVGFFNPLANASRSRLVLDMGWVLADSGFRVVLVDLDPAASLTELIGALDRASSTMFDALTAARYGAAIPAVVEIEASLLIAAADPRLASLDATAVTDSSATELRDALHRLIAALAADADADFVLCDLPAGLGALARAGLACVGPVWVPVSGRKLESYVATGLASTWASWNGVSESPRDRFDWIEVHVGHDAENARAAAARFLDVLGGRVVGRLKEFPSLSTLASVARKPTVALSTADGANDSQLAAVADLRRQHEALATTLLACVGFHRDDAFREKVELALYSVLSDDIPSVLDSLSPGTRIHSISDVEMERIEVRRGGVRVTGGASVDVDLHWGSRDDAVDRSASFPLRFELDLDRSHASANEVRRLDVDTSSFHE